MNQEQETEMAITEIIAPSALEAIERAQVDIQIATAHRFRRPSLSIIKQEIISSATLDEETAASCFYTLARGGKEISGPSVRLAEIAITCFGNLNAGAREISNDGKNITVQAVCHDLEKNVRVCIEVKRKITDRTGKTFSEDMQTVTSNAARSVAFRNAVFKVIPMALIQPAYEQARKTAIGDSKTLSSRRSKAIETFGKMGVTQDRVLAVIEKVTVEDIDLKALETLMGIHTSIKDGDTTIDEAFPINAPPRAKVPKENTAVPGMSPENHELLKQIMQRMEADDIKTSELLAALVPQHLASRQAKTIDDLTPENFQKILDKWDILKAVCKEGK